MSRDLLGDSNSTVRASVLSCFLNVMESSLPAHFNTLAILMKRGREGREGGREERWVLENVCVYVFSRGRGGEREGGGGKVCVYLFSRGYFDS